jgi:hypothetical protein
MQICALLASCRRTDEQQMACSHTQLTKTTTGCSNSISMKKQQASHPLVTLLLEWQAKADVVTQSQVLAPGVLGHVRHAAASLAAALHRPHVAQDGVDQGGLAGTDTADNGNQLSGCAAELGHVEGEVVLAVVLELGVALQQRRVRSGAAVAAGYGQ